jgi:hypothetical protein
VLKIAEGEGLNWLVIGGGTKEIVVPLEVKIKDVILLIAVLVLIPVPLIILVAPVKLGSL